MHKFFSYLVLAAVLFSCSHNNDDVMLEDAMEMDTESSYKNDVAPSLMQRAGYFSANDISSSTSTIVEKKIIKDASIGIEVEDYSVYRLKLDSLIKVLGGYVSQDNLDKNDFSINNYLAIRIPTKSFDKFISVLEKGSEKLLYKNISQRDVTEEFIDIEARLKTKREVEKRYRELLAKARNVKEILEVEEKLRIIREEIESREGRLKYLQNQVDYSTINFQITQKLEYRYEPGKEKNFIQRLIKSLDKGWKGLVIFTLFLIRIWPVILIGFILFFYIRRIRRKRRVKKEEQEKRYRSKKRYYNKPRKSSEERNTKSNN